MDGRLHVRVRTAALIAFALALVIVPVPAVADSPMDGDEVAPTVLSAFAPEFENRVVVGGTQSVTVIASSTGSSDVVVPLGPAPCVCTVGSIDTGDGSVSGGAEGLMWDLGGLGPDTSATLTIVWTPAG